MIQYGKLLYVGKLLLEPCCKKSLNLDPPSPASWVGGSTGTWCCVSILKKDLKLCCQSVLGMEDLSRTRGLDFCVEGKRWRASLRFRGKAFSSLSGHRICPSARGVLFDFGGDGSTNRLSQGLVVAWDSHGGYLEPSACSTWPSSRPGRFHPCSVF